MLTCSTQNTLCLISFSPHDFRLTQLVSRWLKEKLMTKVVKPFLHKTVSQAVTAVAIVLCFLMGSALLKWIGDLVFTALAPL